jgi:hypothetical protein
MGARAPDPASGRGRRGQGRADHHVGPDLTFKTFSWKALSPRISPGSRGCFCLGGALEPLLSAWGVILSAK